MLTIVKLKEGYVVVDIDEDTHIFESLDEAGDLMLEYMSSDKLDRYVQVKKFRQSHAKEIRKDAAANKSAASANTRIAKSTKDPAVRSTAKRYADTQKMLAAHNKDRGESKQKQVDHMTKRLSQRKAAIKSLKDKGKLKSKPA